MKMSERIKFGFGFIDALALQEELGSIAIDKLCRRFHAQCRLEILFDESPGLMHYVFFVISIRLVYEMAQLKKVL